MPQSDQPLGESVDQPVSREPDPLIIRVERAPDALVLSLYGELDLASAPQLNRELLSAESAGEKNVVIDLSGLQFMDSTGLHALLSAHQRSCANGHRISLLRGPSSVHRVFELTHTAELFEFDD